MKPKMPRKKSPQQKLANPSTYNSEEKYQLPKKAKNLALKSALKDFKVTEEEVDFAKCLSPDIRLFAKMRDSENASHLV